MGFVKEKIANIVNGNIELKNMLETIESQNREIIQNQQSIFSTIENNILYNKKIENDEKKFYSDIERIRHDNVERRILIAGFYGAFNTGDELMLNAILSNIHNTDRVYVMLSNNENLIPSFYYKNIKNIIYPLTTSCCSMIVDLFDVIIWAGGAHLDDNEFGFNKYPLSFASMYTYISIDMIQKGKKVYSYGLSSNKSLSNEIYREYLNHIINNCAYFSVRDKNSEKTVREFCGIKGDINIDHDLILTDSFFDYNNEFKRNDHLKRITLINIYNEETYKQIKTLIINLNSILGKDYEIHLLSFYDYCQNDEKYIMRLKNELPEIPIKYRKNIISIADLSEYLTKSDFVIAMRYHGILLSNILGIKTLAIMFNSHLHYYNKVHGIYQSYNLPEYMISLEDTADADILKNEIELLKKDENESTIDVKKIHEDAVKSLNDVLKDIFN